MLNITLYSLLYFHILFLLLKTKKTNFLLVKKNHFDQYKNTYYEIFNINFGIRADLLYETAKKNPDQLLVCGIGGPMKILNGIKLILDDHLDSYSISLESFRFFFCKPVTGQDFFLLFLTANRL